MMSMYAEVGCDRSMLRTMFRRLILVNRSATISCLVPFVRGEKKMLEAPGVFESEGAGACLRACSRWSLLLREMTSGWVAARCSSRLASCVRDVPPVS